MTSHVSLLIRSYCTYSYVCMYFSYEIKISFLDISEIAAGANVPTSPITNSVIESPTINSVTNNNPTVHNQSSQVLSMCLNVLCINTSLIIHNVCIGS